MINNIKLFYHFTVTEFAKQTGDYISLSATDIKVIALTYQLEKEKVGTDHLRSAPAVAKTINATKGQPLEHPKSIAGFYLPGADEDSDSDGGEVEENEEDGQDEREEFKKTMPDENSPLDKEENNEDAELSSSEASDSEDESDYLTASSDTDQAESDDLAARFKSLNCNVEELKLEGNGERKVDDILAPVSNDVEANDDSGDEGSEENDEDSDGGGWITPSEFLHFTRRKIIVTYDNNALKLSF